MLKMNWVFSLVFLGTTWSVVLMEVTESSVLMEETKSPHFMEEAKSSESGSLPEFEIIESVLRSSFENVSRKYLLGDVISRASDPNLRENLGYSHHAVHAANTESWKLACVWEGMYTAARLLQKVVPEIRKLDTLRELDHIKGLCSSLSSSSCGADFKAIHCNPYAEYRSVDGTCNNLQNPRWGAASQPFERYLQADYGDGVMTFRMDSKKRKLPNPRRISRILSNSKERKQPKVTLMFVHWGQFLDHDVTLTPERELKEPNQQGSRVLKCCDWGMECKSDSLGEDCIPIDVEGDSFYRQDNRECIRFIRSMPATRGCSFTPMEQINQNTAFIDGSMIYGSTENVTDDVRNKSRGLLNASPHPGNDKSLPPRGGDNFPLPCPMETQEGPVPECFLAGDIRVDEVPALTALHTAFIRLHNIIAVSLYDLNTHWDDEKLFQETRRIVSALIQQITYRDWLPHLLGPNLMKKFNLDTGRNGYRDTYNPKINPSIRNVVATAAFRFGHTLISDFVKAATDQMNLPQAGNFFNISVILSDDTRPSSLLKGLSRCPSEPSDGFIGSTFTNKLFATPEDAHHYATSKDPHHHHGEGLFGLDLLSLNIQRGRDHGIPSYKEWRQFCGCKDLKNFKNLRKFIQVDIAKEFSHVYKSINDIDLYPASLSENPIDGGLLGETFSCILARQFAQLKYGDRFWYERENQPKAFTPAQLSSIRSQSLATILCKVSDTQYGFQADPFMVPDYSGNGVMDCSNFHFINLHPWKDTTKYH